MVRTHQGAVRAFLRRLCQNDALADDLAQNAFFKAYQNLDGLKELAAARSWLYQIAYRCFIDHFRKDARRRDLDDRHPELDSPPSISAGLSVDIENAMGQLTPDCRAVVLLGLAQGYSHSEIVTITGLPLGTVKSHMNRGKEKLRSFLSAYETA